MLVYYYPNLWVWGSDFRASTFLARTMVPLVVSVGFLGYSARDMGLGWPKLSGQLWKWIFACVILIVAGVSLLKFSRSSHEFYSYLNVSGSFSIFTLSTLPAWEILHRSFLLFGLKNILTKDFKLKPEVVLPLVVANVGAFEVLFHFQKPMIEALGMMAASGVLSWIALESASIWVSMGLHLFVEVVFFIVITN